MSPILFKFEDNDFCLSCLCFFLLYFTFCDSESDTIIPFSSFGVSSRATWTKKGMLLCYFLPFNMVFYRSVDFRWSLH